MKQDEIMEMWNSITKYAPSEVRIAEFANLVAAKEREACAKLCAEDSVQAMDFIGGTFVGGYFANKILARGEV